RHATPVRREIGIRTIFNLLGPLTNPAGARGQVVGVPAADLAPILAQALRDLGAERALVVHGRDGVDEISIAAETAVVELRDGKIREYAVKPEDFGLPRSSLAALRVRDAQESASLIKEILAGKKGAPRDAVLLNAGAAIYVAGLTADLAGGVQAAARSLDSGRAAAALEKLIRISSESQA
ncbi:MAG: anthranilate phosphoribosyltransferase, partial [Planctomycetota bacterium]|nr:anthranilate phosphoribosyltransferase [Planctomycetota bacterium]